MAEEVEMTPVEMTPVDAAEPPKADPLAKPAEPKPATLKLDSVPSKPVAVAAAPGGLKPGLKLPPKPVFGAGLKLPPKPGATVSALRPGLKLPTQSALKPGLKLPPKPGAVVAPTAAKPAVPIAPAAASAPDALAKPVVPTAPAASAAPVAGLKLPPKTGATKTALKPGVRLPSRPMIRKPGEAGASASVPKPVIPKPITPVAQTAAAPAEPTTPASAAADAPSSVVSVAVAVDAQGVGKLPTVEAKAIARDDVTPVVVPGPTPLQQLKSVTQKLKGITQEIPQQAILRKTGIIAEDAMSEAQKAAAKHKTARISLSDAMGVAPVKNESAPLKTIRIKRPVGLPTQTAALKPPTKPAEDSEGAPAQTATAASADAAPAELEAGKATITQRKTLKIARPGGAVRPAGKFGIKRPAAATAPTVKSPSPVAADGETSVADIPEVADIPDIPSVPQPSLTAVAAEEGASWAWTLSAIVQLAACVAIGALAWFLYQNTQTQYF